MERIRQAMEHARREREQRAATRSPPLGDAPRPGRETPPERIRYTRTRTVSLSEEGLRARRVMTGLGTDAVTGAYKLLRTQVLQRLEANGWNSVAVLSAAAREGKTLTAVNLAVSLARELDHTVLLVDADLRAPGVGERLGLTPGPGLADVLRGEASLEEALVNFGIQGLVVLPGRGSCLDSSELIASPAMSRLVDEIRSRYPRRVVVFDLPPLLRSDDALAFTPYVQGVLLVVRDGRTRRRELARASEYLAGVTLLGSVVNECHPAEAGAG